MAASNGGKTFGEKLWSDVRKRKDERGEKIFNLTKKNQNRNNKLFASAAACQDAAMNRNTCCSFSNVEIVDEVQKKFK